MVMMKQYRQLACVRYPPITGPSPNPTPPTNVKMVLFLAFSSNETLSARMILVTMSRPAQPAPCKALPIRSIGNAVFGALAHSVVPTNAVIKALWMAV